ncbi:MAG: peptide chain release factor N(5)-glutamine methyltransferase [Sphingobacteriales bacterium]|nr:MAG: peptide chain release factor N(5)-glutamine methyltransferase [Sphingobacteriales bacterium]
MLPTPIELISYIKHKLSEIYPIREAKNIAVLVTEFVTKSKKINFYLNPSIKLTEEQFYLANFYLQELLQYKPVQYVLGETHFLEIPLIVSPDVLIPRQETEQLVLLIAKFVNQNNMVAPQILDIGTGSGCIALGLKKLLPEANIIALDISKKAIDIAQENAKRNHLFIEFYHGDVLHPNIKNQIPNSFDIVVSNPPYIPVSEKNALSRQVNEFEPHLALFVPEHQNLIFYHSISALAKQILLPGGTLFFEMHENQANNIEALLNNFGFQKIRVYVDLYGKNRIVSAYLPIH